MAIYRVSTVMSFPSFFFLGIICSTPGDFLPSHISSNRRDGECPTSVFNYSLSLSFLTNKKYIGIHKLMMKLMLLRLSSYGAYAPRAQRSRTKETFHQSKIHHLQSLFLFQTESDTRKASSRYTLICLRLRYPQS